MSAEKIDVEFQEHRRSDVMWLIVIGAAAGSLLLLLAIQWLLLEDRSEEKNGFSPDDLLTNIRFETVLELLCLFLPRFHRARGAKSRILAWLARKSRRNRRLQYRIILRMSRDQRRNYLKLSQKEIESLAKRANAEPQDVVDLVIRPCAQIDRLLRRQKPKNL